MQGDSVQRKYVQGDSVQRKYVQGDYVQRNYMYVRRDGAEKYQLAPETVT